MNTTRMRSALASLLVTFFVGVAVGEQPATVTFTFESPAFTAGETTPLLNRAPQIGSSVFRANFTSSPTVNGLSVTTAAVSPSFSGQNLLDPFPPGVADTLRITVNTPITSVQVDFALFAPDHLQLTSAAGSMSAPVVPSTQWGTLSFTSGTPFTSFNLQGFDPSNQPTALAIDNLTMTVVPEPSAFALLSLLLLVAVPFHRKGTGTVALKAADPVYLHRFSSPASCN